MKKLIYGILALVMSVMWSCRNEYDPFDDGNYRIHKEKEKPKMKTVKMSFGGDFITESEEPLLRAEEDPHSYKAVNVYWKEDKDDATEDIYAYGLFVDTDNVEINLFTGFRYRFEATIVIDDRDKVTLSKSTNKYTEPFNKIQASSSAGYADLDPKDINKFLYAEDEKASPTKAYYKFNDLRSGKANVDIAGDKEGYTNPYPMTYPRVKRYYGTLDNFVLTDQDLKVNLEMEYKSFGLKIVVNKLPFGSLTVEDITNTVSTNWQQNLLFPKDLVFNAPNVSEVEEKAIEPYQGLFSMHSMTAEKANFTLRFTWKKGDGVENKIFTRQIEVRPKMNKILTVEVTGTDNSKNFGNVVFTIKDDTFTDNESNIYLNEDDPDNNQPFTGN